MKVSDEKCNNRILLSAVYRIIKSFFTTRYIYETTVKLNIMDLSKACDCLPNNLLIAKFAVYGFDKTALALITDYLTNSDLQIFTSTGKNRGNF